MRIMNPGTEFLCFALSAFQGTFILSVICLYVLTNNSKAPRCSSAWQSSDIEFQLFHISVLNLFWGWVGWFFLRIVEKLLPWALCTFCASSSIVGKAAWKSLPSSALSPILQPSLNTDSSRPGQKVTPQSLEFLSRGRTAALSMSLIFTG